MTKYWDRTFTILFRRRLGSRGKDWICMLNARVKSLANISILTSTDHIPMHMWLVVEHLPTVVMWWVLVQCLCSSSIWINVGISPGAFASLMMFAQLLILLLYMIHYLIGKCMNFQNKYKPNLEILLRDFLGKLILLHFRKSKILGRATEKQTTTKKMRWLLVFNILKIVKD